jgi:anti-sigma B factor antagonist
VTQPAGPVFLVTAEGELDLAAAALFRAKLLDAIARGGRKIILDLLRVTLIDSTNIGALLDAHGRAEQLDGELAVVCRNSNVLKVLAISGIDRLLRIHDSVESAVAEYATEQADADSEQLAESLAPPADSLTQPGAASEERIARNQALFREVNERVEEVQSGEPGTIEFLCECGDPSCLEALPLALEEYEAIRKRPDRFVIAEGHEAAGVERVVARHGAAEVVEKTGKAGRVAEDLDQRRPES